MERAALVIDVDGKFSLIRMTHILEHRFEEVFAYESKKLADSQGAISDLSASQDSTKFIMNCLERLFVVSCCAPTVIPFLLALKQIPELVAAEAIQTVIIENCFAYRFETDYEPIGDEINRLCLAYSLSFIITRRSQNYNLYD